MRVQLDEAWWNERELASSFVRAQLVLGARQVTLWLSGDEPLQWRMSGLSVSEIEVVTRIVGVAPTV